MKILRAVARTAVPWLVAALMYGACLHVWVSGTGARIT